MIWRYLPILVLSISTVWCQCNNGPLYITVSSIVEVQLPLDSMENGAYKHNLHCQWELTSHREAMQLEFTTFDLQRSPDCIFDYLEIYTGVDANKTLVDRWCGSTFPDYIVVSHVYIVFRSDDRVNSAGFSIKAKFTTSSAFRNVQFPISAVEKPQLLYSPFYGETDDAPWVEFKWRVTAPSGSVILVQFKTFCTNNFPLVTVHEYDADFTAPMSENLLQAQCGSPVQDAVTSYSQHLLISVQATQGSKASRQFSVAVSAVNNYTAECTDDGNIRNVTVSHDPHFLLVPYYQNERVGSVTKSCQWHVVTDLVDHMVSMEMLVYDLPPDSMCQDTWVDVHNGVNGSRVLSACRNVDKFSTAESPEMFVKVKVHQSYSLQPLRKAFLMKIYATPMCNEVGERPLVAKYELSYAVMEYNRGPQCSWHVKAEDVSVFKMVDVGVETADAGSYLNRVPYCMQANVSYLQVFKARTTLPAHQVSPVCPFINKQDYRIYGTSLFLPTQPTANMPRDSQSVYYYATRGICDTERVLDLQATLKTQSLFSPNYPNQFWPHELCRWRFKSFDPYYIVSFKVLNFVADQSTIAACSTSQNHIAFYNGNTNNMNKRLILRCAGLESAWISSENRTVFAEFKSFVDTGGRFEILYKAVRNDSSCDKELQAIPTLQNLSSPGFPTGADRNSDCWWRIRGEEEDDVVFVKVLETNMYQRMFGSCQQNYVEAFDGKDSLEGVIIRWCGSQTPMFVSTGKYMYLHLKTDSFNYNKGFLLTYNSTKASITRCGSSLKAFTTVSYLSSPNYPSNYKNHMDCQWNITASTLYNTVKIQVTDTQLEYDCSFDNVSVYDGPSMSHTKLQTFCAQMKPTLQSTGHSIFIRFQSDSSRTHRGFRLKYYETEDRPAVLVCNKRLTSRAEPMYLESPGYPNVYPSNLDCWWIIKADDPAGRVHVQVMRSSIEYSFGCVNDYVSIVDGDSDGRELGRFCGTQEPTYTSPGQSVFILFHTDTDKNENGFRIKYTTTNSCVPGHVTELYVRTFPDFLTSPYYPNVYPNAATCSWRLTTNVTNFIKLIVLESDIEESDNCNYDYVAAYDGHTDSSPELDKWCGTRMPSFTSHSQVMFIKFRSDGSGNRKGFRLQYAGVNTYTYGKSSTSLKAGTVAGVVCGVTVVTIIMVIIVFIIVRQKHKNARNNENGTNPRPRRSRRSRRPPQYEAAGPWINEVFYSQHSGGGLMSPPPYHMVVGTPLPNEPPPPYPASEFDVSLKEEDEEQVPEIAGNQTSGDPICQPPQNEISDQSRANVQSVFPNNNVQGPDMTPGSSDISRQNEDGQVLGNSSDSTSTVHPNRPPRPHPRPRTARPQSRPPRRPDSRDPMDSRQSNIDNPAPQPSWDRRHMSPNARAHSVDNLTSPGQRSNREPLSRSEMVLNVDQGPLSRSGMVPNRDPGPLSRSEMMLNRDQGPLSRSEMVLNHNQGPLSRSEMVLNHNQGPSSRHGRPEEMRSRQRPERPGRQRDRDTNRDQGKRRRTLSDPDEPEETPRDQPDGYVQNPRRNPNKPRGMRNQRAAFDALKKRSRSCDNLADNKQSSTRDFNPRWSVASEGYMNHGLDTRPLGETGPRHSTLSLPATENARSDTDRGRAQGHDPRRSRESLSGQGQRSRSRGSGLNLTDDGRRKDQISGYSPNVILEDDRESEERRGRATETSV